jgi:hypothetical protein
VPAGCQTTAGDDCNDSDPDINPGATEVCDGVDNNCNGNIDEGFDADGDTIADCNDNYRNVYNPDQRDTNLILRPCSRARDWGSRIIVIP